MTDFFRAWIMSLSGIIVFGAMCEMILPSGAYKKYIHLVIGLMLILSILRPIVNNDAELSAQIPDFSEDITDSYAEERQSEEIMSVYRAKLAEAIREEIGDDNAEIECEISESEESYGEIESIVIETDESVDIGSIEKLRAKYGTAEDKIIVKHGSQGE